MYIADLHIHSRFSRATSRDGDLPHLDWWARRKGLALVGTLPIQPGAKSSTSSSSPPGRASTPSGAIYVCLKMLRKGALCL